MLLDIKIKEQSNLKLVESRSTPMWKRSRQRRTRSTKNADHGVIANGCTFGLVAGFENRRRRRTRLIWKVMMSRLYVTLLHRPLSDSCYRRQVRHATGLNLNHTSDTTSGAKEYEFVACLTSVKLLDMEQCANVLNPVSLNAYNFAA